MSPALNVLTLRTATAAELERHRERTRLEALREINHLITAAEGSILEDGKMYAILDKFVATFDPHPDNHDGPDERHFHVQKRTHGRRASQ